MKIPREIKLKVIDFERIIFEDSALAVTTYNQFGILDILPLHSNFITIIKDKVVITKMNGEKHEVEIKHGVLRNVNNMVEIFIGI